jgi:hypothetical protein
VVVDGALLGSGPATLDFGLAGTDNLANISGFTTIGLANGGKNTLSLSNANYTGTAGVVTINDGNSGNTINGSGLSGGNSIVVYAGGGADLLTGGTGNDIFYAGDDTTMNGGKGTNEFAFSTTGNNTIKDFGASPSNELVFSNIGFNLGFSGASSTPTSMGSAATTLFTVGSFTSQSQRFAYDKSNGELSFSSDGGKGTPQLVAALSDHATIGASQLFFAA